MTARDALRSLDLAQAELHRLRRRQRVLTISSVAGLAILAFRGVAAVLAPPASHWQFSLGTGLALGLAACVFGLVVAHRWNRRVQDLRADIFTLEFLDSALIHERAPVVLEHPYRAKPERTRATERDTISPSAQGYEPWRVATALGTIAAVVLGAVLLLQVSKPERHRWTFTEPGTAVTDLGLTTPVARAGAWQLEDDAHATGGRALVNHAGDSEEGAALAVTNQLRARNVRATTRCKVSIVSPNNACGLVFRFHDPANHYVAHLDAGAGLIALKVVSAGVERTIQEHPAEISGGVWQELAVEAHARRIVVSWNGKKVIDAHDRTLSSPGEVGLWAPATGAATFDELSVEALTSLIL